MRDNRRYRTPNEASSVRDVSISLIRESDRFRLREPPYGDIDALAASIAAQGQLMPIGLMPQSTDGYHDTIYGHRRVAAIRQLGLPTVSAKVFELDEQAAYLLAVSENQQRGDLTEIERATICLRLQEQGQTYELIAKHMGWSSEKSVQRYIRLAREASLPLREALKARRISLRGADVFLRLAKDLADDKQRELLASDALTEMSADELDAYLRRSRSIPRPSLQKSCETIRSLKNGGFVLKSLRFESDNLDAVRTSIELLKTALQKARRLERTITQSSQPEISEEEVAS
jgi:ParB family chromosome partitioning protein